MKHILIDYENIQPKNFAGIDTKQCHIWLFLGVHQQKSLPLEFVEKLLRFDSQNVHIVRMQNSGKNALDFYLAFYLGKISELDPKATVCIIARDSGYDVLVEHLNMHHDGMDIIRMPNCEKLGVIHNLCDPQPILNSIDHTANLKPNLPNHTRQPTKNLSIYQQAIASLKNRPAKSRPAKKQTLKNHLQHHLKDTQPSVIDNTVKQMIANKAIVIKNNKLSYNL